MLLNPIFLYCSLWIIFIILYSLQLSHILIPWTQTALIFLFSTILMFLLGWFFYIIRKKRLIIKPRLNIELYKNWLFSNDVSLKLRTLTFILTLGYLIEILYAGNVPLLYLIGIGKQIYYTEFGIPGVHGLLNACFLVVCNILFFRQILQPNKKRAVFLKCTVFVPIFFVSRQFLLSLLVQYVFINLLVFPIKLTDIFKNVLFFVLTILVFGYIGDLRSSRELILNLMQPTFEYPDYLPSGFIWAYSYLTTPINNLIANCDIISPSYLPIQLFGSLFPSFIKDTFYSYIDYQIPEWNLVVDAFNVSSMHQKFITDFGLFFTPVFYCFISYIFTAIMDSASLKPQYGLTLVVILHGIAFSVFNDLIFNLPFISQMLIYIFYFKKTRIKFS